MTPSRLALFVTSAVGETRKEAYYVRDPSVHVRASPGWIGDDPDDDQDTHDPAHDLSYQGVTSHCRGKVFLFLLCFFAAEAKEARLPSEFMQEPDVTQLSCRRSTQNLASTPAAAFRKV